jgi:zinc protease
MIRRFLLALALVVAAPAWAPALAQDAAPTAPIQPRHEWPFEESDLPPDPEYRFGRLDNGMRYIIRPNGTPAGQGMVQFWVDAGSVAETEEERGYAHFVEHMAFNGSRKVPEGERSSCSSARGWRSGRTPTPRPISTSRSTCSTCRATIRRCSTLR